MKLTKKGLLLAGATLVILVIAILFFFRFFPVNKLWKVAGNRRIESDTTGRRVLPAPNALYFDFESGPQRGNSSDFYEGIAHTGKYSTKAFGKNSYSASVERTVREIGPGNLTAVGMSAWVYVFPGKNEVNGSFVFSANNAVGANLCWKGIHVSGDRVVRGKWFKISGYFDLSDITFKPDSRILIYFWNNSNTDILIDDYYIVFGSQHARTGDSVLVDMTRGTPFFPRFNRPPFPFVYLEKDEIHNDDSPWLIRNREEKDGNIGPYDQIFSGHFFGTEETPEDIFVIDPQGHPAAYLYCSADGGFKKVTVNPADAADGWFRDAKILCGSFLPGRGCQVLIVRDRETILTGFDRITAPCSRGTLTADLKVLWRSADPGILTTDGKPALRVTADFDGNKCDEILSINPSGAYRLLRFEGGSSGPVSVRSQEGKMPEGPWNPEEFVVKITPGKFLPPWQKDMLLAVARNKRSGAAVYSLFRFEGGNFIPVFPERQLGYGKTIGLDTLRPEDEFFTGRFEVRGIQRIFRYDREWRFDLKEIRFNDTTFQTLNVMDFRGYEKDRNPKYFEILKIVPGNFLDPSKKSFLVIGRNCRKRDPANGSCLEFEDYGLLPNTLQFYSYPANSK